MIKHLVLLTFICFLFACRSQGDKNSYAHLIKGDWVGLQQDSEYTVNNPIFVSFEDSTYQKDLQQDSFHYEVSKDTLYFKNVSNEGHHYLVKFPIIKLTADSLVLLDGPEREYTLRFSKVRAKNTITPDTIRFAMGSPGASMYLQIDSSRNIRFYGSGFIDLKGGFWGRISESDYHAIVNKIRNLPVDSLQNFYDAGGDDGTAMGVFIIHGNKTIHSAAYEHGREPMELNLLFARLNTIYKHVNMQPDSMLNDGYSFWNYNIMHELMPMPERFLPQKILPGKEK
jgi:hypothetical protein